RAREVLRRRRHSEAQAAGAPEEGQEAHEAGRLCRGPPGGLPRRPQPRRRQAMTKAGVRHLYVHLPFCASRCGYCDFVTLVGRRDEHGRYVDALLTELMLDRDLLTEHVETIYLGGGTPTLTDPVALERLLAALPDADEVTV